MMRGGCVYRHHRHESIMMEQLECLAHAQTVVTRFFPPHTATGYEGNIHQCGLSTVRDICTYLHTGTYKHMTVSMETKEVWSPPHHSESGWLKEGWADLVVGLEVSLLLAVRLVYNELDVYKPLQDVHHLKVDGRGVK